MARDRWATYTRGMRPVALVLAVLATPPAAEPETQRPGPPHQQRVEVEDVLVAAGQYVVILRTEAVPRRYVPIWVGEGEAMAIRMRIDRYRPPRPLTLNLLESVMKDSHVRLRSVTIDAVRGGVFFGALHLRQGDRDFAIDARPSDAIGLALGGDAPIWMSLQVLDSVSFDPKTLAPPGPEAPEAAPPAPFPSRKPDEARPDRDYGETL